MTATLRYNVGVNAGNILRVALPRLLKALNATECLVWAGQARGHREAIRFSIKLPAQVRLAIHVLEAARDYSYCRDGMAAFSFRALHKKLARSLGLPGPDYSNCDAAPGERCFLDAIAQKPEDLTNWLVYADWLEEFGDEGQRARAMAIRLWNSKKAAKVKYGVLLTNQEE
jgi:uncharacterized protein (TIGR02996 family)